jgi:plastocyanin
MVNLNRRLFTAAVLAISGLVRSGAHAAAAAPKTWSVRIDPRTSRFVPGALTIKVGDTVEWTNPSFVLHSVDFDPAVSKVSGNVVLPQGVSPFSSPEMEQDAKFSHTFTVKGDYKYICQYHEGMGMVAAVTVA